MVLLVLGLFLAMLMAHQMGQLLLIRQGCQQEPLLEIFRLQSLIV
jgi:hypothetical protein